MATMPSSSSPPSLSSASNSDNSPTKPTPHSPPKDQVNAGENDPNDKKPDLPTNFHDVCLTNHIEKFKKYEADYSRRLMAKYFSKKNLYGGNIFDDTKIADEIIKSSRWPCTQSYADPVKAFEEQSSSNSATITETPSNISNGKHTTEKNG